MLKDFNKDSRFPIHLSIFIVVCLRTLPLFYYTASNGRMVCGITKRDCERIGCGLCTGSTPEFFFG